MKYEKKLNKKDKKVYWHCRFELNQKTFRPKADTKEKLEKLVREIQNQEDTEQANNKYKLNLEIISFIPSLAEVLKNAFPRIAKPHQKKLAERVFEEFQNLLPAMIKVNELQKRHFQIYLDFRTSQIGKQSKQPVKVQTIYKELYAIRSALKPVPIYYDSLQNWQIPELPKMPSGTKKKAQRQRLVTSNELESVIDRLLNDPDAKRTKQQTYNRIRLAHQLEFQHQTGLRRKEIANLKFAQFDEKENALRNVKRWKTDTITKFFPVSRRAVEIIDARRELQKESDYIFTPDGLPIESTYRTLKKVCEDLKIPYGRFIDGGFVAHDLRHNFGTEILRESDIETARELLGHSNIAQTATYLHTNAERLREAVRKREKFDYKIELERIFDAIEKKELTREKFIEEMQKLIGF